MLEKTRAIALHTIKFGDSGIIVYVYTERFGRQTYLIKNAHSKKNQIKANIFCPLNLLELEVYYKQTSELQKLKEAINYPVIQSIFSNPSKNAIAFFLAEVIYRSLREEVPNSPLFEFIFNAILLLDKKSSPDFHLVFLMKMLRFCGFSPTNNYTAKNSIFDLLNSEFVDSTPLHGHFIHSDYSSLFSQLIENDFNTVDQLNFNRESRQLILEKIVEYYRLHVEGLGQIKSLHVLKEVFD